GSRAYIDGTFAVPDALLELLALHLHHLGAAQAKVVAFLADGAPWIWERLDWVIGRVGLRPRQVVKVLDWCHAAHHLSLALQAAGLEGSQRRRWYEKLKRWLRAGQAQRVVRQLLRWAMDYP